MQNQLEILLASDFSARSDRPLDRALQLARELNAKLVIAHVLEPKEGSPDDETLERLRRDLPPEARDMELVVRTGSAPHVLEELAAERGSDLVITGVARMNSIRDYVLGTAVDYIVRHVDAPVLVVRRRASNPYAHMIVATDMSGHARTALVMAARLFPNASITLVHAYHVPYEGWFKSGDVKKHVRQEAAEGLDAILTHPDVAAFADRIEIIAEEGETLTAVTRQLERTGAQLLVLGTHGRSELAHATIGSEAESLLKSVDVDVLMVSGCQV